MLQSHSLSTELTGHANVEFSLHWLLATLKNSQIVTPADLCNQWLHSVVIMVEQVELAYVWIGNITLGMQLRRVAPSAACRC